MKGAARRTPFRFKGHTRASAHAHSPTGTKNSERGLKAQKIGAAQPAPPALRVSIHGCANGLRIWGDTATRSMHPRGAALLNFASRISSGGAGEPNPSPPSSGCACGGASPASLGNALRTRGLGSSLGAISEDDRSCCSGRTNRRAERRHAKRRDRTKRGNTDTSQTRTRANMRCVN